MSNAARLRWEPCSGGSPHRAPPPPSSPQRTIKRRVFNPPRNGRAAKGVSPPQRPGGGRRAGKVTALDGSRGGWDAEGAARRPFGRRWSRAGEPCCPPREAWGAPVPDRQPFALVCLVAERALESCGVGVASGLEGSDRGTRRRRLLGWLGVAQPHQRGSPRVPRACPRPSGVPRTSRAAPPICRVPRSRHRPCPSLLVLHVPGSTTSPVPTPRRGTLPAEVLVLSLLQGFAS